MKKNIKITLTKLFGADLYSNMSLQFNQLKSLGIINFARWHLVLLNTWIRDRFNRHVYTIIEEAELLKSRKSDTVFIFGSGYSLHEISPYEWRYFEKHDTLGFTGFVYQKWIRVDYYLLRGWVECFAAAVKWRGHTEEYLKILHKNHYFKNSIFIMQGEYMAQFCNSLIGYRLLKAGNRIFRYATAPRSRRFPSRLLKEGLNHNIGTMCDAVNLAYCLGWKEIVLVGVDLYDLRYFWLKPNETVNVNKDTGMLISAEKSLKGLRYDQPHNMVNNGIIELFGEWREMFEKEKVYLKVYNPKSLLAKVMPVYKIGH